MSKNDTILQTFSNIESYMQDNFFSKNMIQTKIYNKNLKYFLLQSVLFFFYFEFFEQDAFRDRS